MESQLEARHRDPVVGCHIGGDRRCLTVVAELARHLLNIRKDTWPMTQKLARFVREKVGIVCAEVADRYQLDVAET
jgi:hypothetical protein